MPVASSSVVVIRKYSICSSASEGLLFSASSSYIAVVAIDFGTTYSGFAFAFNYKKGEGGIHMNKAWGHDQGAATLKTPTSLLLRPDGKFDSFGYEAEEKYANFSDGEDRDYLYFKHFKMALHKSETLDRNTKLTARNGKTVDALVVFAHSMRFLKDRAIEIIRERTGDEKYNEKDIRWVITVPAIWRPAAKQFMREAAYKAKMASDNNPEQLLIALEPEAASIYCREMKMREFTNEKGDATVSDVFARPESKYLVIDIGGGTLDVTAHEILNNGNIKEIHQVTGGPYGGTKVDEEFVCLLESFFGTSQVKNFRDNYPAEWLEMMNEFEMKKRGRRAYEGEATRIRLPRTFTALVSEQGGPYLARRFASSCRTDDVQFVRNEYFCIGPAAMKKLFEPVLNEIVKHLNNLLKHRMLRKLQFFFLVGGFAESAILQDAIKQNFGRRCRILVPSNASIAVVQGAVMFGQIPDIVDSRVMSTTYGFDTYLPFDPSLHPIEKQQIVDGVAYCEDCFVVLVKENDIVRTGEKKVFPDYRPLKESQTACRFSFFTSTNPDAKYSTDAAVSNSIGEVVVKSPIVTKGANRMIDLAIEFGGTEIKATAIDKNSGNTATVYLDFLGSKE
ncbi:heat shock 70 kDa protein 12A-like isoform X1 [Stylophora pistillata]|uniref:heat shock 70 kDa protein 12A-like isoform X1 n=1 Tax=Stylophora pistillata TaxID=50429 RepID=UPI000C03D888|nr:heat shock 70 kDa protein 12A-like isoform X1 [Stylophora pistillata]